MKIALGTIMAAAGFIATTAHGDALLTYELIQKGKEARVQKVAIDRFFARVDDSAKPETYLLFQAGKYFPLYEVNPSEKSYRQLTLEVKPTLHAGSGGTAARPPAATAEQNKAVEPEATPSESAEKTTEQPAVAVAGDASGKPEAPTPVTARAAETPLSPTEQTTKGDGDQVEANSPADSSKENPAAVAAKAKAKPELRATKGSRRIAGINCRVVEEIEDGNPVMQHCMANKARLGITERETRTLARLFAMARDRGYGWLGAGTADEDFVAVQTRNLADGSELNLKSVSTDPLPADRLQIPTEFKQAK